MAEPFIGEIKMVGFNFAPIGWAFCNGALMPIAQNEALFVLIGTTYGGNGQSTFALPDLRGRAIVGIDQAPGLSLYLLGQAEGTPSVSLQASQLPPHNHALNVNSDLGSIGVPENAYLAKSPMALGYVYGSSVGGSKPTSAGGNSSPHNNMQPFLAMNYIIATEGIFPSQN